MYVDPITRVALTEYLYLTKILHLCRSYYQSFFGRIPIHYKVTLMYVDPITRRTHDYAIPIPRDNNPIHIIELDPDSDDQDCLILRPEPIKREPPMFTPSYMKTT